MNEYAYKMEGLDKEWTFLKSNRKVYYTKLAPGNYTFQSKRIQQQRCMEQTGSPLEIKIYPPWWGSIWAYILYAAAICRYCVLLIKSYLNRVE